MKPFHQMFDSGTVPLGTWIMSASHLITEATGHAGFDWAVLDMEHTPSDLGTLVHLLQANLGSPMLPIVRVPWNDTVMIKRVLDVGAVPCRKSKSQPSWACVTCCWYRRVKPRV